MLLFWTLVLFGFLGVASALVVMFFLALTRVTAEGVGGFKHLGNILKREAVWGPGAPEKAPRALPKVPQTG